MASKLGSVDKGKWKGRFDYNVDYNDHFETPLVAYRDILPLLDALKSSLDRKNYVLYDPYYCNGRTSVLLQGLGFEKVVHAKRDFYKDISDGKVPTHHTMITNPPYSDQHKEKCLEFCTQQFREHQRPFFLLMPNYVAARSYYRNILGDCISDVVYLIPSTPYEYDHPEGTGHGISPFASLWFCGVGRENVDNLKAAWQMHELVLSDGESPTFVGSLRELESIRAIPTEKRPNPRQRKKRKDTLTTGIAKKHQLSSGKAMNTSKAQTTPPAKANTSKKSSIYRDGKGQRIKKRF